jgi:hypothetical protein
MAQGGAIFVGFAEKMTAEQLKARRVTALLCLLCTFGPIALAVLLAVRFALPTWALIVLGLIAYLGFLALMVCWLAVASRDYPPEE